MNSPDPSFPFERPDPRPGAVALVSGGLDSAVMVGLSVKSADPVWPLYVRQGFVWEERELAAMRRYLDSLDAGGQNVIKRLSVVTLDAPSGFASAWAVDGSQSAPDHATTDEAVYLPGRNLALLTQGAQLAFVLGVRRIQLGVLRGNPFPDAAAGFFRAFEETVERAMGWRLGIETPLGGLTKVETLRMGREFDLGLTLSCIRPDGELHCGRCNKCAERRKAFRTADLPDPTTYAAEDPANRKS